MPESCRRCWETGVTRVEGQGRGNLKKGRGWQATEGTWRPDEGSIQGGRAWTKVPRYLGSQSPDSRNGRQGCLEDGDSKGGAGGAEPKRSG